MPYNTLLHSSTREAYGLNLSNSVVIIDEAHNIKDPDDNKLIPKILEEVLDNADELKLILLTATPMFNQPEEIIWILNMLLMNDKKCILSEKDIFDNDGNLINEELLQNKSKGYISYLRGENPINFPFKLFPTQDQIIKLSKLKRKKLNQKRILSYLGLLECRKGKSLGKENLNLPHRI